MKKIHLCKIILCMLLLVACNDKSEISNNIIKDGQDYMVDNISFFYPKKYEIKSESPSLVILTLEDASLTFKKSVKTDGNKDDELVQLYRLDLENDGYTILSNTTISLDNGDNCQEIVYGNDQIKAKTLIMIDDEIITFTYEANIETFDDTIHSINYYLYSLSVKEVEEQLIDSK